MEAQQSVEAKLADFDKRTDNRLQQEQAQAFAPQQQEQVKTKEPEIERARRGAEAEYSCA